MCLAAKPLFSMGAPILCVGGTNLFIADGLTYVVPVFIRSARVFAMASACSVPVRGGSLEWTKEPFGPSYSRLERRVNPAARTKALATSYVEVGV